MKTVVTGGAGFIGSHITEALISRGDEVHIVDNLSTGKRENVHSDAHFHEVDIRDFDKLEPIFKGADVVFHEAALARVQPSIVDPRTSHEVNTTGTQNVFLAARNAEVRRVVLASSASIYGNQETLPFVETMRPQPISPYALQKLSGELIAELFAKIYKLETVSLRYFNIYGPRMPGEGAYALAIGIFLQQRKEGKPLTIVPDGNQSRDFTHVRDCVRANLLAADSTNVGEGEVINIGAGHRRTVLEIADLIGGERVWIEPRIEPKAAEANNTKARELLGWQPEVKFEDGIAELKQLFGIPS